MSGARGTADSDGVEEASSVGGTLSIASELKAVKFEIGIVMPSCDIWKSSAVRPRTGRPLRSRT